MPKQPPTNAPDPFKPEEDSGGLRSLLGRADEMIQPPKSKPLPKDVTQPMHEAMHWLAERGGSGVFTKQRRLMAGGDVSSHGSETWRNMEERGYLERDADGARVRQTQRALDHCALYHKHSSLAAQVRHGRVEPLPGAE